MTWLIGLWWKRTLTEYKMFHESCHIYLSPARFVRNKCWEWKWIQLTTFVFPMSRSSKTFHMNDISVLQAQLGNTQREREKEDIANDFHFLSYNISFFLCPAKSGIQCIYVCIHFSAIVWVCKLKYHTFDLLCRWCHFYVCVCKCNSYICAFHNDQHFGFPEYEKTVLSVVLKYSLRATFYFWWYCVYVSVFVLMYLYVLYVLFLILYIGVSADI